MKELEAAEVINSRHIHDLIITLIYTNELLNFLGADLLI